MENSWLDNYSWQPDLLVDKRPLIEASQEPVEPNERATGVHTDPVPGTIDYLMLGCDHLYQDLGGEG